MVNLLRWWAVSISNLADFYKLTEKWAFRKATSKEC
jgi:hypothetical protein